MKKKILGFLSTSAFMLVSATSLGQINVGVNSATKATTNVNTAAVNNAVGKTVKTTTTATTTAVTKASNVSTTAAGKVNNAKPEVKTNVGLQTAAGVNAAGNNSGNQSSGNGNSEKGTTIHTSSQTTATVSGEVSTNNTTDAVKETKTKVKDDADQTKTKIKGTGKKAKEKVRKQNHGLEVSTEAKAQGEIKRQNNK